MDIPNCKYLLGREDPSIYDGVYEWVCLKNNKKQRRIGNNNRVLKFSLCENCKELGVKAYEAPQRTRHKGRIINITGCSEKECGGCRESMWLRESVTYVCAVTSKSCGSLIAKRRKWCIKNEVVAQMWGAL
jgi:hypothetical protein